MPKIQMRRDTAANWKSANPVLLCGEWALETDTQKMKIGDGTAPYNTLDYFRADDNVWQKPAGWADIRSGALDNSIYYLVAHSADYQTYPTFTFTARLSNPANTYEVYVDGVKVATTAHATATTLTWQTLTGTNGQAVTYPSALITHVVRVTPTQAEDIFTQLSPVTADNGVLWIHVQLNYRFNVARLAQYCVLLEAITAANDTLLFDDTVANDAGKGLGWWLYRAGSSAPQGVLHLPVLTGSASTGKTAYTYYAYNGAKINNCVVRYRDCKLSSTGESSSWTAKALQTQNAYVGLGSVFRGASIKQLPPLNTVDITGTTPSVSNLPNLEPTVLDLSTGYHALKRLQVFGTAAARMDGLIGLLAPGGAPFDGASPQVNVAYTGLSRAALVNLFNSLPQVSASQVCNITGAAGAGDLTADDLAVATAKGWTVTR